MDDLEKIRQELMELNRVFSQFADNRKALKGILAYAESQFECSYKEHHDRCLACQKISVIVDMAKEALLE